MWLTGSDLGLAAPGRLLWTGRRPLSVDGDPARLRVVADPDESVRVAVVGDCYATGDELAAAPAAVKQGRWRALTRWPGSYWVVADDGMHITVLTDVAGTRPVYFTSHADGTAWASRAALLAGLTGAGFDLDAIAARMTCPTVSEICGTTTAYSGISRLPAGHALQIGAGDPQLIAYEPEDEMLPFADAAIALREALVAAVETRARASSRLSSDFSGGLDSTSLALLAVRGGHPLLAVTHDDVTSVNDDVCYARLLAAGEPLITHSLTPGGGLFFDRMDQAPATDQPCTDAARWAMHASYQQQILDHGSDLHLTGAGGDTLLAASPFYLADLVSAQPAAAGELLRHSTARARLRHLPVRTVLTSAVALAHCSYPAALRRLATEVRDPVPQWERAAASRKLRWCGSAGFAAWLTPDARARLAARIEAAADHTDLNGTPTSRHRAWSELREFGAYPPELATQTRAGGVNVHAPFLDNQVVRAAMAIPVAQRQSINVQKPLLGAALSGLVPKMLLDRPTKGAYDGNAFAGLRANAHHIHALLENSQLAAAGIVDLTPVRAELDRLIAGVPGRLASLETLITTELWLAQPHHTTTWTPVEHSNA